MRKKLLLTCLLTLVAAFGMAQETTKWPITLTTADGLPGTKVVLNYMYQSKTYNLDEAVQKLRFTVISTNTVDTLTTATSDGLSAGWGTGFPFFTMSELRIYNGEGKSIEYTASGNAVASNDGGGLEALNDKNEGTYLHTTYSRGTLPNAYHYIELELAEPVNSFSFNWNTRSGYHKNLITYMGITPGTQYLPFPEQQFELGEQVTTLDEIAEEGSLFVIRSNGEEGFIYNPDQEGYNRVVAGKAFFHSPYGADVTPNAASLVYLIPDATVKNGYKVYWLNNGHYLIKQELNPGWFNWTNDELKAGTIEFAPCDSVEGAFTMSMNDGEYIIGYDALGKMALAQNVDTLLAKRSRPTTFHFNIYKASINGSAITAQLQAAIDEAQTRLDAVGLHEEDDGEFEALTAAVAKANALVANPEVAASEIIAATRELNVLTAAYAAVTIWAYVDSIDAINSAVEAEEIKISSAPDWIEGSYREAEFKTLIAMSDEVQIVIDNYQSLAEIDAAIESIFTAIDNFWASKVSNVKSLPFRLGSTEDGLPGVLESYGGYHWESPVYNITEEVTTLRMTVFKTNNMGVYSGTQFVFPTWGEIEFYDGNGNKIPLTAENFSFPACYAGDGNGIPGLCDGDVNTHCHGVWNSGKVDSYDAAPTYQYLEITFPEPISTFKFVQYGRKNGVNTPTDFVFGVGGKSCTPEDVDIPDFYNTTLGEQVTSVDQITDDGFYALVGLLNCAPEGDGSGFEKFYSGKLAFDTKVAAPTVFSIRKTGDEDGSMYIQSIADGSYWSQEIDDDGWCAGTVTSDKAKAGKFIIKPMPRAEYEKADFPGTFLIYQYNDTVVRGEGNAPYIVAQDWGDNTGYFSVADFGLNDWDGEGEWKIFKVTMDTPHLYWLKSVYTAASSLNLIVGTDPGYYSVASAGEYGAAMAKAQQAIETGDDAVAKEALNEIEATLAQAATAVTNPVIPGIYVIETANANFMANQGKSKVICTYFNNFEANSPNCTSEYSLFWADAPADFATAHDRYKFELISASDNEKIQILLEDGAITAEQAANAFYIKSVEVGQYAGTSVEGARSQDIGLTIDPEEPYIIRPQGAYKFDFWHYSHGNASLHMEGNSGGGGDGGDIVYWAASDASSQWHLRYLGSATSIDDNVVAEGDEVVSVTYYTVGGVQVAAPVRGVNIVKTVYANGVVKTVKVFVK